MATSGWQKNNTYSYKRVNENRLAERLTYYIQGGVKKSWVVQFCPVKKKKKKKRKYGICFFRIGKKEVPTNGRTYILGLEEVYSASIFFNILALSLSYYIRV